MDRDKYNFKSNHQHIEDMYRCVDTKNPIGAAAFLLLTQELHGIRIPEALDQAQRVLNDVKRQSKQTYQAARQYIREEL